MKACYRWVVCLAILLAMGVGASLVFSRETHAQAAAKPAKPARTSTAAPAAQGDIERGRYLVEDIGMCEECHTPRDANGNLDESRRLQGAAIWIVPVHPNTSWAMRAPALAGFPGFTDDQGAQILENGIGPNGLAIQPPMHVYHMTPADAKAVIAYLRSLPNMYPRE
jgi:mono/diheme cytochrome c family protein